LIYILLAASLITFLLGHWIDSGVILAVIVIIDVIQEGKAEKAMASIRNILALNVVTLRDGRRNNWFPAILFYCNPGIKYPPTSGYSPPEICALMNQRSPENPKPSKNPID
jgi:hypothetical protein